MSNNPLTAYARIPKLAIYLPSQGRFNDISESQSVLTGEIQVKPMTGVDELLLKNPDALLSGEGIARVIRHCTDIEDVYSLMNTDVNALLLAIRYASYGRILEIEVICPKCGTEFSTGIDLEVKMGSIESLKEEYVTILKSELIVSVKPHTFKIAQQAALKTFIETKSLNKFAEMDNLDSLVAFTKSFNSIAQLSVNAVIESIISITIPDGGVITEVNYIREFVNDISKDDMNKIIEIMEEANASSYDKETEITCVDADKCGHAWKTDVEVNTTNFFDGGSPS